MNNYSRATRDESIQHIISLLARAEAAEYMSSTWEYYQAQAQALMEQTGITRSDLDLGMIGEQRFELLESALAEKRHEYWTKKSQRQAFKAKATARLGVCVAGLLAFAVLVNVLRLIGWL